MRCGPPTTEAHWEAFTRIEGQAFATDAEQTASYVASVRPHAIARFAFDDDERVIGGALALPCTQVFGGSPLPAGAVASVCVAPERRGSGVGRRVMSSLVGAMREAGLVVAPLWPTSVDFYRSMDWELAGTSECRTVAADHLRRLNASGSAEPEPVLQDVRALRGHTQQHWSGPLDRPAWWWEWRRTAKPGQRSYTYGWREGDALTGFIGWTQRPPAPGRQWGFEVWVNDFWAATGDALNGLAALVGADAPLSPTVHFDYGVLPPSPDLAFRLPEPGLGVVGTNGWMLRILDPLAAIAGSGWPAHLTTSIALQITGNEQQPTELTAAFVGGEARVRVGGTPDVRISSGAFAAWFAGNLSARRAATLGLASGSEATLEAMDALTADRTPWLPDMF